MQGLLARGGSRHTALSSATTSSSLSSPLTASSTDLLDVDSVFDSPTFSLGAAGDAGDAERGVGRGAGRGAGLGALHADAGDVARSLVYVNSPYPDCGSPTPTPPRLNQDPQDLQDLLADRSSRVRFRSERELHLIDTQAAVDRWKGFDRSRTKRLERYLSEPHR